MLTAWVSVTRVAISGAERLYPDGIDWKLQPGINAVIGGTSLGKTTLVYALQFAIFERVIIEGERVEREFFKDRLTKRSAEQIEKHPPIVEANFTIGQSLYSVKRNLLTGAQLAASCNEAPLTVAQYRAALASDTGLTGDFQGIGKLQGHLLFLGEARYLLAWDNLTQNELLNLMLSEQSTYERLNDLWSKTESADSEARNLSAQASRLERDIETLSGGDNVKELARRSKMNELSEERELRETTLASIEGMLKRESSKLQGHEVELAHAQAEFHAQLDRLEERPGNDLDAVLLSAAAATPTSDSVRYSLEQFYKKPQERSCPCCGRPGLPEPAMNFAKESLAAAKAGNCIICSKDLGPVTKAKVPANSDAEESTDASALRLQAALFKREQLKSRIEDLSAQAVQAASRLASARASELEFRERNPASSVAPLKVAVETMRSRQRDAESRRSRALRLLRKELASTNDAFASIQSGIAKAFKKYASLYLDETCDVELLSESSLPGRKGPQVKAPHAAFYPVISGQTRPSAQALSDAQRTFVDLALRMAIIDVWHRQTKGVVTLIVETPEGATDLAYMERVANMLGAFSKSGHTIIVTSNLNNQFFLPELMAVHPKGERASRMLNLLDKGRPHSVQEAHKRHFRQILNEVATRRVIS